MMAVAVGLNFVKFSFWGGELTVPGIPMSTLWGVFGKTLR